ncbi:MAG: thymidylate kinase [Candidatus Bathyarchaeia archaeon]
MTFIIIDGLDGSGKSTQAQFILKFLEKGGKTVCLRVHPEKDNFFGVKARQFLYSSGKSAHFAAALFYMIDVIRSILLYSWRKVDYIIFVRYLMGTAYLPAPLHKIAYHFFAFVVLKSEIMIFLDVNPEEAVSRIAKSRGEREMFEDFNALSEVRAKALSLAFSGKWIIVNSNKPAIEVAAAIKKIIS